MSEKKLLLDVNISEFNAEVEAKYPSVLIVDDQSFNILAISAQIESLGASVESASSGMMALEMVNERIEIM